MEEYNLKPEKEPKSRPYLQVYAGLFILTIFEFITSNLDNWGVVNARNLIISVLILFALSKIILIGAFFMHAKYEYDTTQIIIGTLLLPLLGVGILTAVMMLDFRGSAIPF